MRVRAGMAVNELKKTKSNYARLLGRLMTLQHYGSAMALLSWDQETYMPEGGSAQRAELGSALSELWHSYFVNRETEALLGTWIKVSSGVFRTSPRLGSAERVVIRETHRQFARMKRVPSRHVAEEARVASLSQHAWIEARKKSDFSIALPHLDKIIRLKRKSCEYIGYDKHPYDALIDGYEPHTRTSDIDRIFGELREPLSRIATLLQRSQKKSAALNISAHPEEEAGVRSFCTELMEKMGFDFNSGRLDESVHPFATMIHPGDVRMTVRKEKSPVDQIFSTLHEGGHSLYNQGLDRRHWGTPLGEAVSLGIHESQSRLWENQVGRSRAFWKYFYPRLRKKIPRTLARVGIDDFLREVNRVSFSFIRVEADEVTYGLHVILRYELEKAMIDGSLEARDLPAAWNERMERYLGIKPKNDAQGCLQDVHWYCGGVGYFPTYVLGNLYAAQFNRAWNREHPRWAADMQDGRLEPLTKWLREKVHRHGSRYTPAELVKRVTGEPLRAQYFLEYLHEKYGVSSVSQ